MVATGNGASAERSLQPREEASEGSGIGAAGTPSRPPTGRSPPPAPLGPPPPLPQLCSGTSRRPLRWAAARPRKRQKLPAPSVKATWQAGLQPSALEAPADRTRPRCACPVLPPPPTRGGSGVALCSLPGGRFSLRGSERRPRDAFTGAGVEIGLCTQSPASPAGRHWPGGFSPRRFRFPLSPAHTSGV